MPMTTTARVQPIHIMDKSITQIGREQHQKYTAKHPFSKAVMTKQVFRGEEKDHTNVVINSVESSK